MESAQAINSGHNDTDEPAANDCNCGSKRERYGYPNNRIDPGLNTPSNAKYARIAKSLSHSQYYQVEGNDGSSNGANHQLNRALMFSAYCERDYSRACSSE